jgi:flagellar hook-associated protein 3 FlgL
MRIATSTIYENQTASIDNLVAQQQQYGQVLSSGKQLNAPSDDPAQIAQDLSVRTSIAQENQDGLNVQNASSQLTTVDGALASLTSVMQSARSIAVQAGAGDLSTTQRAALASQVNGLLQQAIGIANTKYSGKYVFAGTTNPTGPAVTTSGVPISQVVFNGNLDAQSEQFSNGATVTTSVTMQQAFNFNAPDGSPDVFQTLINLRNTLSSNTVTDASASGVNAPNTAISTATTIAQLMGPPQLMRTPLTADSAGNVSVTVTTPQSPGGSLVTLLPTDTIATALTKLNAAGVSATWDSAQQRLVLTAGSDFQLADSPSAGATNTGNFLSAFGLQTQANLTTDTSRQLGDIDNATQTVLTARAALGANLQSLTSVGQAMSSQAVNDTKVQSGIEDADIAKVISQFSQTQTALQAAYGTTTRLESKTLFDYLQ